MIKVENLTKKFGNQTVLDRVSFTVPSKSLYLLTGKSGCGKTTLLKILGLVDRPTSGKVFLDGVDVGVLSDAEKAKTLFPENCSVAALSSSEIMEGLEAQRRTINAILLTGGILLAAAFAVVSVYETLAAAKEGRHSLSVLLAQGMNLKQLFSVVFIATLAAAFAAFMTSTIVGAALNYLIYRSVTGNIAAAGFVNWAAYGISAGITAALALAISLLAAGINRLAFGKSKYKQEN